MRGRTRWSVLGLLALLWGSCDACDGDRAGPEADREGPAPEVLARVCVPSPAGLWDELRETAGLTYTVEQVAAELIGLPRDQLSSEVDWQRPLTAVLFQPPTKEISREAAVVVVSRPAGAPPPSISGGAEQRTINTSGGQLQLRADRDTIALARGDRTLAPGQAVARGFCPPGKNGAPALVAEISPELLDSREVKSWVARRGAWLEATARQATARRGRPTLGDPETLARILARRLEETRARAREAAPLRLTLSPTAEGMLLRLSGSRSPLSERAGGEPPSRPPPLGFFPPDAYLVIASWSGGEARRDHAGELIGAWARVAGDRLPAEERDQLRALATRVAEASDGWVALALRPALEPGPLVALAVVETEDPAALTSALAESAETLSRGYLQSALEHLGARIEVAEQHRSDETGAVRFRVEPPPSPEGRDHGGDPGERGSVVRTLTGSEPTLAWRAQAGRVLIVFGPDPDRELARLVESAEGSPASILTQPLLAAVVEARPRARFYGYGWTPALGAALTRGAPAAQGLPEGGVALASGPEGGEWRAAIHLGPDQVVALLGLLGSEEQR